MTMRARKTTEWREFPGRGRRESSKQKCQNALVAKMTFEKNVIQTKEMTNAKALRYRKKPNLAAVEWIK